MNESPCKVAFVGAGYMTSEHVKAFRDIECVELSGIYSRTKGRAEQMAKEAGIATVCSSMNELYERSGAQLVVISVPELSVREVCLEAFQYPWVCLIEKPAGYDVTDAKTILATAKELRREAFVALNRRHYSSTRTILDDITKQSGPRLIQVFDQEDQVAARKAKQPELVVKNWMYANSIHVIDYLTILGRGAIVAVDPIIPWDPEDPRFVMAKVTYDSGDIGVYQAVWNGPGPWSVSVTSQEKRWELRPLEQVSVQPYGSRKAELLAVHEWDSQFKPGLRQQAAEALKAVRGEPHSLPSLDDALASMKLVQAIYGNGFRNA
jgi:predicted dehydrogenase